MSKKCVVLFLVVMGMAAYAHAGGIVYTSGPNTDTGSSGTADVGLFLHDSWPPPVGPTGEAEVVDGGGNRLVWSKGTADLSSTLTAGGFCVDGSSTVEFEITQAAANMDSAIATAEAHTSFDMSFIVDLPTAVLLTLDGSVESSKGIILTDSHAEVVFSDSLGNTQTFYSDRASDNGPFAAIYFLQPGVTYTLSATSRISLDTELLGGPIALAGVASASFNVCGVACTPEPTTLSLLLLGMGGMVYRRVRKTA